MAFLAAMMLSYMQERRAFLAFVGLMAQPPTRMAAMFTHDLALVRVRQHQLRRAIEKCLPKVYASLVRFDVVESMWATHWVLTALAHSFPFAVVARLWDAFLCEGWKAVLRFCLAVLKVFAPELESSASFEELVGTLGTMPQLLRSRLDDPEACSFLAGESSRGGPLTVDAIAEMAWEMPLVTSELDAWAEEGTRLVEEQRKKDQARKAEIDAKRAARAASRKLPSEPVGAGAATAARHSAGTATGGANGGPARPLEGKATAARG